MDALLTGYSQGLLLVGAAAGLCVLFLALAVFLLWRRGQDPAARRLEGLAGGLPSMEDQPAGRSLKDLGVALLSRLAEPARPRHAWQESELRNRLARAGFRSPSATRIFLGLRVACLLLAMVWVLLSPLPQRAGTLPLVLALVGAACLGYMAPQLILESRTRRRQKAITRELPDVLDLLVITVEAGLGLDAAIKRVSQEVALSCPLLGGELNLLSLELRAGIPRAMALRNLAQRCGVDEMSGLVTMLIQADRFGVSVGRSLRVHSDTVRTKRRQQMEEAAAKIPLKLLFPVLFMIFPAIMVVMAGPAIIRVSQGLFR
ncbi:MAG: type II secretion system F family protein [Desulfarculus sp.]|nr:MAG: type II secretion system F family protein [Desulfarculus sp.]